MEWAGPSQHQPIEVMQKSGRGGGGDGGLVFLGRRSYAPRPLSEATEIFDTDSEDGSSSASLVSLVEDSQSTSSNSDEVKTPHTGGLGGFEFHFDDKPVVGPQGPHLFRASPEIFHRHEDDHLLNMSPVEAPSDGERPTAEPPPMTQNPMVEPSSKPASRPFTSLNTAVAELDEFQVRDWTPQQVADWMADAGFESSVVDKFLIHDISGSVLLDLQFEDLKELDISSFGKRHRVMSSIHHLRNSSMISLETPLSRTPSKVNRHARTLQRPPRADECHVVAQSRSHSRRRGGRRRDPNDVVTPAESVSIVAIEQLLPKEHKCSKGEDCPKWQKQRRKILQIQRDFAEENQRPTSDVKSEVVPPSLVGSSDVLGPSQLKITAEALRDVQPRDPQESIRQFLNFQHLHSPSHSTNPSPPPAASACFAAKSAKPANLAVHLKDLPKLTIPVEKTEDDSPETTPLSAFRQPSQVQKRLRAQLQNDPYHYGGVASPADMYRVETPFSATDIPVTAPVPDPCERDISQSVPPGMRYGAPPPTSSGGTTDPVRRPSSTQPVRRPHRHASFTPSIAPVREHVSSVDEVDQGEILVRAATPSTRLTELDLATHQGWMRKRRTTRLRRHEWQDHYFNLTGNKLTMLENDQVDATALDYIDVDQYTLHAYSVASSSKLSAAFKKSILGSGKGPVYEAAFAFSLIPEHERPKKLFEKNKTHHFAVDSSKERVEWMRKLMLAKAMKKNDTFQI